MKKTKRILSMLTALAITASAFASMVIPASAAEVAISGADYDFETGSAWTCTQADFGVAITEDATLNSKVLSASLSNKNANRAGAVSLPTAIETGSDGYVKVSFDWFSKTVGLGCKTETSIVGADDKKIVTLSESYQGSGSNPTNVVSVNGENVLTDSNATIKALTWYTVTAVIDFGTKKVSSLTFAKSDTPATIVATLTDIAFNDSDASGISGLYINSTKGSGNINLTWAIDNFKAYNITETFVADFTVNAGSDPLEGANVTIDGKDYLTNAAGKAFIRLANGSHSYTISKGGYEVAQGSSLTGTVSESSKTASATMQIETYTPIASKVTVGGGQKLVAAASGDTPNTTAAFTVVVKDQFDFDMSSGYTTEWAVYPTGTTTANDNVTIANGVVSVAKGYTTTNEAAVFDVVATVTDSNDSTKTASNKTTILVANSDIIWYDMETSYTATGAKSKDFDLDEISIPETGLRLSFNFFKGKYDSTKDTAYGKLSIMNGEDTVLYLEDKNAGLTLYTDGDNSLGLGTTARDTAYPTELSIIGSQIIVKFNNGDYKVAQFDTAPEKITAINVSTSQDGGSGTGATNLVISSKLNVDTTGVNVLGDDDFAVIAGKTVTRQYTAKPYISESSDNFTWTVTDKAGVSIDASTGLLSVTDAATAGKVTVTATSGTKTGSLEVDIKGVQTYTADVTYPKTVAKGESAKLTVNKITDALGDDVTDYFVPTWSIDGVEDADSALSYTGLTPGKATALYATYKNDVLTSLTSEEVTVKEDGTLTVAAPSGAKVYIWNSLDEEHGMKPVSAEVKTAATTELTTQLAAIGSKSGNLTTNDAAESGDVTVKLDITGSDATPAEYTITVAEFSRVVTKDDVEADEGVVDVADIVTYGATSFNVVLPDGTVTAKTAADNKITLASADFGDYEEAEIIPTYKFNFGDTDVAGYVTVNAEKANGYGLASAGTAVAGAKSDSGVQAQGINLNTNSFEVDIPDGLYDMTFYKTNPNRTNIRLNGYYVIPEADYNDGDNPEAKAAAGGIYTKCDVVVDGGIAKITADNWDTGTQTGGYIIGAVEISKKSKFETRKPHIWILGDSTVTNYRPTPSSKEDWAAGTRRSGWGQLFQYYLGDDVIVDNFAHSGDYAEQAVTQTFPTIMSQVKSGDYVFIQYGINDRTHAPGQKDTTPMKEALEKMVDGVRSAGAIPVLITPEICITQYGGNDDDQMKNLIGDTWTNATAEEKVVLKEHVQSNGSGNSGFFGTNRTVAANKNVLLIDLADLSGKLWAEMGRTWVAKNYFMYDTANNTQLDAQHMSYQGAKLVASMVATDILDQKANNASAANGENFSAIPVNAKVQANITYKDASDDNAEKTVTRQAAEYKSPIAAD